MMESVSSQGLRQRHTNTSSDKTSEELTLEMPTKVSFENSLLHHDLDDEIMSDEITATPFQTRSGSPSRGEIMPHTVAQAAKLMSDLNAIVDADTASNAAEMGSNASNATESNEKSPESDDGVPVPVAPLSVVVKTRFFGLTKPDIIVLVVWLCVLLLLSPYLFHILGVRTNPNDQRQCGC